MLADIRSYIDTVTMTEASMVTDMNLTLLSPHHKPLLMQEADKHMQKLTPNWPNWLLELHLRPIVLNAQMLYNYATINHGAWPA